MTRFDDQNRQITDTIDQRVRVGRDPMVSGWQQLCADILSKMQPYLAIGQMVTFQQLLPLEKTFFSRLLNMVTVPENVQALYIPPSVRHQMMYANHGPGARINVDHDPDNPPDAGVVLACAANSFDVILNALFAHPPTLAAVDVYDRGGLIGGYTYPDIEACMTSLSDLMQTHLGRE